MKRLVVMAAVLLAGIFTTASAQDQPQRERPTIEQQVQRTIERLKPDVAFTEQQEKDVKPIFTDYYTAMQKAREGGNRPSQEDRDKWNKERDEKLAKVLSADQMTKLKAAEEKMRSQRRPGGGGNGGPGGGGQ